MTLTKHVLLMVLAASTLVACDKEKPEPPVAAPSFTATVDGVESDFAASLIVESIPSGNNNYILKIVGEKKITADSSVFIRFIIPDFTKSSTPFVNHSLNPAFNGGFIEQKKIPDAVQGALHFFQTGDCRVNVDAQQKLHGNFNFVLFLFDRFGAKIGERHFTNGRFANLTMVQY